MNLHACVIILGIAAELRCDVHAAARRVLKMADAGAKPYVRLFLLSSDPLAVARIALREYEKCKPSEPTTMVSAPTTTAASLMSLGISQPVIALTSA